MTPAVLAFRLRPRFDPKPWGGHRLGHPGTRAPGEEPIGEAVATAGDAVVADGPFADRTLADIVAADPLGTIGPRGLAATGGRPLFPLLVKLIDAAETLSLQLHPDDAAAAHLGRLGKSEVYHVLAADPGAEIAVGLRPGVSIDAFAAACRAGAGGGRALVRWLPVVPGDSILIPAGTVHAIGAGCFVYELQQPSDVTYRLDDWGRRDAAGRPRELHVAAALAVLDSSLRPDAIVPLALPSAMGRRQLLAACRLFALERIEVAEGDEVAIAASGSAQTVTCLRGSVRAAPSTMGFAVDASEGETAVICAAAPAVRLRGTASAVVLRGWVPDLATEIVAPARAAGHGDAAIAALAGPLSDLGPNPVGPATPRR